MKILFINDCNGNEYSNPYTDLVEIDDQLVDVDKFRNLEAMQLGVSRRGGSWKEIMIDGLISYNHISSGKLSDFKDSNYDIEYRVISGNY
jgi:hypothetical protein